MVGESPEQFLCREVTKSIPWYKASTAYSKNLYLTINGATQKYSIKGIVQQVGHLP